MNFTLLRRQSVTGHGTQFWFQVCRHSPGSVGGRITPAVMRSYCSFDAVPFPSYPLPPAKSVCPCGAASGTLAKIRTAALAPSHARPNPLDTTFASLPKKFALLVHSLPLAEYLVVLVHDDCAVVKKILLVYSHCLPPLYVAHVQRQ